MGPIIVFHGCHFVRYLGICNRICVKFLQLTGAVITHNSLKNEVYINQWLSCNQLYCFTADIIAAILEFVIRFVLIPYRLCPLLYRTIYKNQFLYLKAFSWGPQTRHTPAHTHTHDESIRWNAMRCISPKNTINEHKCKIRSR